jgi:hypothetical protein
MPGRVIFGAPEHVVRQLQILGETVGLSALITEANIGGRIPPGSVLQSIRLFAQGVFIESLMTCHEAILHA